MSVFSDMQQKAAREAARERISQESDQRYAQRRVARSHIEQEFEPVTNDLMQEVVNSRDFNEWSTEVAELGERHFMGGWVSGYCQLSSVRQQCRNEKSVKHRKMA